MAGTAFVLGGTGQIGRAVAGRLADSGWAVVVGVRNPAGLPEELAARGIEAHRVDRANGEELRAAVAAGADVLVDVIAYDRADAEQLLALAPIVGSIVAISSASVYADEAGRTLDEAKHPDQAPFLPVPVSEDQPTVPPGEATYSTRKVAMEQTLLGSELPTTIIRPCAVHGPGSPIPRELFFVKRALDGRRLVVLADAGRSVFHTTSVENLAELVRLAAEHPATRILNSGDPEPPTALEIERACAGALGHGWTEVLLPGQMSWGAVGDHPWAAPHPFVVDTRRAETELGYRPVTGYREAVGATCAWLADAIRGRDWRDAFPEAVEYLGPLFDYEAEDTFLAELGGAARAGS